VAMLEFERILRPGYRLTNQRRVIVREIEGQHLSAEEIYDRVKGHPELGLSTVYARSTC